jgi:hypothetical protein
MKKPLLLVLGCVLLSATPSRSEPLALEKVARSYAVAQPGLQTYRATIDTDNTDQILERMTANLPADAPRPPAPKLVKFWARATERTLLWDEESNAFQLMQDMDKRYPAEFSIELRSFLLPIDKAGERARLLEKSRIIRSENLLGETRIESLSIDFTEPADLNGAFYGRGLSIPQERIKRLVIDLDLGQETVRRMEVTTSSGDFRTVEFRHYDIRGAKLLNEVLIASPDGAVDDRFKIRFDLVDGFWLPTRMYHTNLKGTLQEKLYAKFIDYEVNGELPAGVRQQLLP